MKISFYTDVRWCSWSTTENGRVVPWSKTLVVVLEFSQGIVSVWSIHCWTCSSPSVDNNDVFSSEYKKKIFLLFWKKFMFYRFSMHYSIQWESSVFVFDWVLTLTDRNRSNQIALKWNANIETFQKKHSFTSHYWLLSWRYTFTFVFICRQLLK